MASDSVIGAVIDRFEFSDLLTGIYGTSPTRVFKDEEPEGIALPYVWVEETGSEEEHVSGGHYIETLSLVFHAYAEGEDGLRDHVKAIRAVFNRDMPPLDFESASVRQIDFRPLGPTARVEEPRNVDGDQVSHATVPYEVKVQREE